MPDSVPTPSDSVPKPSDPVPASPPSPRPPAQAAQQTSFKETIESVLIALILAFVFRAFVVEAFVIPTGSMAPTLMGAHMRFTCDDCGYPFQVGYNAADGGSDADLNIPSQAVVRVGGQIVPRIYSLYCPNCGYKVPRLKPDDPDNDATGPSIHYGDRILVLKYAHLLQAPRRWEVVVFKAPQTREGEKNPYQTNYIKRLIGLPGESVMILDGDIYISPNGADWTIQTKTPVAQEALWRIVYDNDFYPRGLKRDGAIPPWQQPWRPVDGTDAWDLGNSPQTGRTFTFDGLQRSGTLRFDPDVNPDAHALTDWVAYDATTHQGELDMYARRVHLPIAANVSDVRLDTWYTRLEGDGPLRLRLGKLEDVFTAEILPDRVRLLRSRPGGDDAPQEVLQEAAFSPGAGRPIHLSFTNVDYQVTLRVDDKPLLQTTPQQYQPDLEQLLEAYRRDEKLPKPTVQISAADQKATLTHTSLWRDVYYLNRMGGYSWGAPDHAVHLGLGEYFVLGDNSAVSLDARGWSIPINLPSEGLFLESGRVPERFMLGRAFFVYWPSGFRIGANGPAVIPNFGEMRFIE